MIIRFLKAIILSFPIISCSASRLIPTVQDVNAASEHGIRVNPDSLKSGYILYKNKCGKCHYLHRPSKYSEEKWISEMPEMSVKAHLSEDEKKSIINYILTMKKIDEIGNNKVNP